MQNRPGSATAAQPERRRSHRFSFDAVLELEWGSATLLGRVRDISADGMLIEASDPLWIGARFSARLLLNEPLGVECVVRRVEPGKGMGVVFAVPDETGKARLKALLDSLTTK